MAQIISSEVLSDRPQANGFRYIRYEFVVEDNNGLQSTKLTSAKLVEPNFDEQADMLVVGPQLLTQLAEAEIREFVDVCASGGDPLHDWVGYWVKSSPAWNTWEVATTGTLKHFLSQEDQLQLVHINDTVSRISNGDLVDTLGVSVPQVGGIRGDIQVAINTRDSLAAYERWYDDAGNLVR